MSDHPRGSEANPIIIRDLDGSLTYVVQEKPIVVHVEGLVVITDQEEDSIALYPAAAAELFRAGLSVWGTPEEQARYQTKETT